MLSAFPQWMVFVHVMEDTPVLVLEQTLWRCNHTRETLHLPAGPEEKKLTLLSGTTRVFNSER